MSLSSHQSTRMGTDTWLTPPELVKALGKFDLDPCCPDTMPWQTADVMLTKREDGLVTPWHGRVWLNPPFSKEAALWLQKLVAHGNGIALVPARTETRAWFDYIWDAADAVLFLRSRPHFYYVTGERAKANSGAPIALIAYGPRNVDALHTVCNIGKLIYLFRPSLTYANTASKQ